MIIAIVMAGGKGKRLDSDYEKPLFPIKDKCLIDYVLDNLNQSNYLDEIIIAISHNTLITKKHLIKKYDAKPLTFNSNSNNSSNSSNSSNISNSNNSSNGNTDDKFKFQYLETPGEGYLNDLSFILDTFNSDSSNHILLFINSDLPLVNSQIIDYVLDVYNNSNKPALSVLVPIEIFEKYNLDYSYQLNGNVPSGLNILISQNIIQEEEKLIIQSLELAFNVNTLDTAKQIDRFL